MSLLVIVIALGALAGFVGLVSLVVVLCLAAAYGDERPTDADRYCDSIGAEWDELAARRATRPVGNVVVVDFSRPRGVA